MAASKTTKKAAPKSAAKATQQAAPAAAPKAPAKPAPKAAQKTAKKAPPKSTAKKTAKHHPPAGGAPQIEAATFRLTILEGNGTHDFDTGVDQIVIAPPTWFAATLTAPLDKRYLYLLQKEKATGYIVLLLLTDRDAGGGQRLPPAGAFQRAIVAGTVHVLGSDDPLNRAQIVAAIGGHEPPPTSTRPPYT